MSRLSVSIVSAVVVLIASVGGAFAATSPQVGPAVAAVGDEVTFFNGCYLVVDEPPSEVPVALTQGDEQPEDKTAEKTLGTLGDPNRYSFVVPDVQPGDYSGFLECAPAIGVRISGARWCGAADGLRGRVWSISGAQISVFKFIDADGNLSTFEIRQWVRAGSSSSSSPMGQSRMRSR